MRLSLRPLPLVLGIILSLLGTLSLLHPAHAQFDPLGADLGGAVAGDVAWADVDGDGDSDLLVIGNESGSTEDTAQPSATLYENQGDGNFSPIGAGLTGVSLGSAAFGDFDDDGDPDLVITGNTGGFSADNLPENSAKVYENDGSGNFTELGADIEGVTVGSVDWGDTDGDGDLDLVVTGNVGGFGELNPFCPPICNPPEPSIRIYEGDGTGSFTQVDAGIEEGVAIGSSNFGDIDDDGDLDLAVTGGQGSLDDPMPFSAVYENDGDGTFTKTDAGITDLAGRTSLWTDVNGDESLDLVLTGITGEEGDDHTTRLYLNDGNGGFSKKSTDLPNVAGGAVAAADVDLDGDMDLLVSGQDNSDNVIASVFENDGTGAFTSFEAGLTPVEGGAAAWGDIGLETTPDLALVGRDADSTATAAIYENQIGGIAEAQFIHNAADPAADTVDVYFGNERALDDVGFRSATEFIDVPADVDIETGVAPAESNGPDDVIATGTVTLTPGEAHTVVANGVLNPADFEPNPDGEEIAFEFFVETGANMAAPASGSEVDLRAVHGATDAPTVDIDENGTTLLDDLTYGDVTASYRSVTAEEKRLVVTPGDSDDPIAAFQADLSGLGGSAATVLASGFLDPAANQDGPAFRLIAAQPNGDVVTFAPNQPPTVATPLPDDTLETPGPPLQLIGLGTTVFDDPEGDSLSFSATSSDPSVVGAVEDTSEVLLQPEGTGTAEVAVAASDGIQKTNTSVQVTVEEQEGEEPIAQALALVAASGANQTFDFRSAGNKIVPIGVEESGPVKVQRFESAPSDTSGIDEENVSESRTVITAGDDLVLGADTEVRFPVEDFTGIEDPTQVTVYSRPTPGDGTFNSLPTSVDEKGTTGDSTDDEIVATTGSFSEFVLASNTEPLPVELAAFTATFDESTVQLQWETAGETDNAGFRVQHETAQGWKTLGFVESKAEGGTTTEGQIYRFGVGQNLNPGTHRFRLTQVDLDGSTSLSKVVSTEVPLREALMLSAPSPNPVSGQATLSFAVKDASEAEVVVYNMLGQKVRTLYQGTPQAGQSKTLTLQAGELPSGVYILQLRADGQTRTQRLTVVR